MSTLCQWRTFRHSFDHLVGGQEEGLNYNLVAGSWAVVTLAAEFESFEANNSVHVTVSTIRRSSFMCGQL